MVAVMSSKPDPRVWQAVEHASAISEVRARRAIVRELSVRKAAKNLQEAVGAFGRGEIDLQRLLDERMAYCLRCPDRD